MNKRIKLTGLTTAALATLVLAGTNLNENVKADALNANVKNEQKAQSPKKIAQSNVESAEREVVQAQNNVDEKSKGLSDAKKNAETSDKAYSNQKLQVKEAKNVLLDKQAAAKVVQAEVIKAQKLVDNVKETEKVKKNIESKEADINKQQQGLSIVQKQVSVQKNKVNESKKNLSDKQQALAQATNSKEQADEAVKQIKSTLANTDDADVQKRIADVKDKQQSIQAKLTTANKLLKLAKDKTNGLKKEIKNNNDELEKVNNSLKQSQQSESNKKQAITVAQDELNKSVEKASIKTEGAAGFFKYLMEDNNLSKEQRTDAKVAYRLIKNLGKENIDNDPSYNGKLTWYDQAVKLGQSDDATSLQNLLVSLNDLASFKKVRETYDGGNLPNVSLTATAFAMLAADYQRTASKFDYPDKESLPADEGFTEDMREVGGGLLLNGNANEHDPILSDKGYMGEKHKIDNAVKNNPVLKKFTFENSLPLTIKDYQFKLEPIIEYADLFTGHIFSENMDKSIEGYMDLINPDFGTLGMARYSGKTASGLNGVQATKIFLPTYMYEVYGKNKTSGRTTLMGSNHDMLASGGFKPEQIKSSNKSYYYPSFTIDEYTKLVKDYVNNVSNSKVIQEKLDNASQELERIIAAMQNREKDKANITASLSKLEKDLQNGNADVDSANAEVEKQSKELKATKAELNILTSSYADKQKNLDEAISKQAKAAAVSSHAKQMVENAKKTVDSELKTLSTLNEKVSSLQQRLTSSNKDLTQLKQYYNDLQNAPQILATAQSNLKKAQATVDNAQSNLESAQNKLNNFRNSKDEADDKVKQAQDAYDAADKELTDAKTKLTKAKDALAEIERQEQEAAELADQEAQAQVEAAQKEADAKKEQAKTKSIELTHNAYVYDKDGNAIQVNGQNKKLYKGDAIKAYSNAKVVTINGKKFYQIGKNKFVKVANTIARKTKKTTVPKSAKLTHNAFVYDKNGKRVKLTWIKRGSTIKPTKLVTINGKKYYQIGKNKFVKVANTKAKTKSVKVVATVKGNSKVATYDRSGKKNGHHILGGHTYKFNEKLIINGKTYYKIAGKNDWVRASKLNLKK